MSLNYRKRIKILPGVKINISKKGISTTIGVKGLGVNIGKKGAYLNTGIPGTGIYSRQKIAGGAQRRQSSSKSVQNSKAQEYLMAHQHPDKESPGCMASLSLFFFIICFIAAFIFFVIGMDSAGMVLILCGVVFVIVYLVQYTGLRDREKERERLSDAVYDEIVSAMNKLFSFLRKTEKNAKAMDSLNIGFLKTCNKTYKFSIDARLGIVVLVDLIKCYKYLGFDVHENKCENIALAMFIFKLIEINNANELLCTRGYLLGQFRTHTISVVDACNSTFTCSVPDDKLVLSEVFKEANIDKDVIKEYSTIIYELMAALKKIDGDTSVNEFGLMGYILQDMNGNSLTDTKNETKSDGKQ